MFIAMKLEMFALHWVQASSHPPLHRCIHARQTVAAALLHHHMGLLVQVLVAMETAGAVVVQLTACKKAEGQLVGLKGVADPVAERAVLKDTAGLGM